MAIDVYVQLDGIQGESRDATHPGWIEAQHVEWGVTQPRSATSSTSGGHTAERAEFEELTFLKHADLSTPLLLQMCSTGKTIPSARVELYRADAIGSRVKYFEIDLANVLVAHVAAVIQPGDILAESVGLKFSKVKWSYARQTIAGGAAGNTTGGWDLATNRVAA